MEREQPPLSQHERCSCVLDAARGALSELEGWIDVDRYRGELESASAPSATSDTEDRLRTIGSLMMLGAMRNYWTSADGLRLLKNAVFTENQWGVGAQDLKGNADAIDDILQEAFALLTERVRKYERRDPHQFSGNPPKAWFPFESSFPGIASTYVWKARGRWFHQRNKVLPDTGQEGCTWKEDSGPTPMSDIPNPIDEAEVVTQRVEAEDTGREILAALRDLQALLGEGDDLSGGFSPHHRARVRNREHYDSIIVKSALTFVNMLLSRLEVSMADALSLPLPLPNDTREALDEVSVLEQLRTLIRKSIVDTDQSLKSSNAKEQDRNADKLVQRARPDVAFLLHVAFQHSQDRLGLDRPESTNEIADGHGRPDRDEVSEISHRYFDTLRTDLMLMQIQSLPSLMLEGTNTNGYSRALAGGLRQWSALALDRVRRYLLPGADKNSKDRVFKAASGVIEKMRVAARAGTSAPVVRARMKASDERLGDGQRMCAELLLELDADLYELLAIYEPEENES